MDQSLRRIDVVVLCTDYGVLRIRVKVAETCYDVRSTKAYSVPTNSCGTTGLKELSTPYSWKKLDRPLLTTPQSTSNTTTPPKTSPLVSICEDDKKDRSYIALYRVHEHLRITPPHSDLPSSDAPHSTELVSGSQGWYSISWRYMNDNDIVL